MSTVILGGGIIGLSTAYYLSKLDPSHEIHIIDSASSLHLSASAYAGGFLASDWFNSRVSSLGALSFKLHKQLAKENNGSRQWSYMPSMTYSLSVDERGVSTKGKGDADDWITEGTSRAEAAPTGDGAGRNEMLNADGTPAWFKRQRGGTLELIDGEGGCAQVEPKQLCMFLLKECESRGVKVHTGCYPTHILKDEHGKVAGLKMQKDTEVFDKHCKNILFSAGAWTPRVFAKLFPESKIRIPIDPLAGYSIVANSPRHSKPILDPKLHSEDAGPGISHAVYCAPTSNWSFAPEAFSRVGNEGKPEIWAGGLNDSGLKLPETADGVQELRNKENTEELRSAMVAMTGLSKEGDDLAVDGLEIKREGLCFRPLSRSGSPIISQVPANKLGKGIEMAEGGGVFIASGHGPWGISLSLGTGMVMAELLTGQKPSADISGLRV